MIAQPLVVAGLMASATMAGVIDRREETSICGAPSLSSEQMKSYKSIMARSAEGGIFNRQASDDQPLEIATVIHVVAEDNTLEGGMLSNESVAKSVEIMNKLYAPAKITFKLQDVTFTADPNLATYGNDGGMAMKQQLRKGDSSVLNLYYVRNFGRPGLKGECTFPTAPGPGDARDGCAIASDSIPGGPAERQANVGGGRQNFPGMPNFHRQVNGMNPREERKNDPNDFGITKVGSHEVGHWFGLPHTFSEDGTCRAMGDLAPESGPAMTCRAGQNRCGATPEQEEALNQNIMSYADCPKQAFSPGQMQFMRQNFRERRQTNGDGRGSRGPGGDGGPGGGQGGPGGEAPRPGPGPNQPVPDPASPFPGNGQGDVNGPPPNAPPGWPSQGQFPPGAGMPPFPGTSPNGGSHQPQGHPGFPPFTGFDPNGVSRGGIEAASVPDPDGFQGAGSEPLDVPIQIYY